MKKKLGLDPKDHSKELSEALTRLVDKPEAGVIALKAECR